MATGGVAPPARWRRLPNRYRVCRAARIDPRAIAGY